MNGCQPTPDLSSARKALALFLADAPTNARLVALHDIDADGVAAAVVWLRAMQRMGWNQLQLVLPDRDRNAWTDENRVRVEAARPERLFVLDLGSRAEPVIAGVPTCFIDHHRPEGSPPGDTLISAYTWRPVPNTSWICWDLFSPLVDISDLDWVAVIGTLSDLGERAPFAQIESAKKRYVAKYLKEATTLINAARRAADFYDPEAAVRAILAHRSPKELVLSGSEDVAKLRLARGEVKIALEEAKRAAPVFAGRVALVRLNSRCQVHPLLAQIWRSRLPKYIVIVANEGFSPGRVHFSARSMEGTNVLDFLAGLKEEEDVRWGHGHDQASGGVLPVEQWNALLRKIGFGESVMASD
jgi:single-stranded-DNA-specific exonuclease